MSNESPLIGWKDEKKRKSNGEKTENLPDSNHDDSGGGEDGDGSGDNHDDAKETTPMQPKFVPANTQVRLFE